MTQVHESDLIAGLAHIQIPGRAAFAAACAQRLVTGLEKTRRVEWRSGPIGLGHTLSAVWSELLAEPAERLELDAAIERCIALVSSPTAVAWSHTVAYTDDAASAVAYVLRTLKTGSPQEAAWAGRRVTDALDHHVVNELGVRDADAASHPVVRAELDRQIRDIARLRVESARWNETVAELRLRSIQSGADFFGGA